MVMVRHGAANNGRITDSFNCTLHCRLDLEQGEAGRSNNKDVYQCTESIISSLVTIHQIAAARHKEKNILFFLGQNYINIVPFFLCSMFVLCLFLFTYMKLSCNAEIRYVYERKVVKDQKTKVYTSYMIEICQTIL